MLTTLSGWLLRGVTAIVQLVSIRLVSEQFGIEKYAMFAILGALWGWFQLADFGFGGAFLNALTHAQESAYARLVAFGLRVVVILSVGAAFVSVTAGPMVGCFLLPEVAGITCEERGNIFIGVSLVMMLTAIWGISYRALFALEKGWLSNLLQLTGAIGGLGAIYLMTRSETLLSENAFQNAVIAYWLPPMITAAICYLLLMRITKSVAGADAADERPHDLYGRARKFFMIGVVAMASVQADLLIAAKLLESADIATYSVVSKIFTLGYFACTAMTASMWSSLGAMFVKGELSKIHLMMRRYLLIAAVLIVMLTGMFLAVRQLVSETLLVDSDLEIGFAVIVLFGVYTLIRAWTDFFATIVSAGDDLNYAFWCIASQAVVSIALQIALALHYGGIGLVIGAATGFLLTTAWAFPLRVYVKLRT